MSPLTCLFYKQFPPPPMMQPFLVPYEFPLPGKFHCLGNNFRQDGLIWYKGIPWDCNNFKMFPSVCGNGQNRSWWKLRNRASAFYAEVSWNLRLGTRWYERLFSAWDAGELLPARTDNWWTSNLTWYMAAYYLPVIVGKEYKKMYPGLLLTKRELGWNRNSEICISWFPE